MCTILVELVQTIQWVKLEIPYIALQGIFSRLQGIFRQGHNEPTRKSRVATSRLGTMDGRVVAVLRSFVRTCGTGRSMVPDIRLDRHPDRN